MGQQPQQSQNKATGDRPDGNRERPVPWWRVVLSVIQAALGVQSRANRERDFTHGKLIHYIITAVAFTAIFVLVLIGIVNLVIG